MYTPFFEALHDETRPIGKGLGRGTHYSVLRAVTWHDTFLNPLPKAEVLDFAVIWDEDHDTRVIQVIDALYFEGLLAPVRFIGEHKGGLTVLVAMETAAAWEDLTRYSERVKEAMQSSDLDDSWHVSVEYAGSGESSIISAKDDKVAVYLRNIEILWDLGIKPRPVATLFEQESERRRPASVLRASE